MGYSCPGPAGEPPPAGGGPDAGVLGRLALALIAASLRPLRRAVPPPATVVDLGAGGGARALAAARLGYRVVAIEPDPGEAARARRRLGGRGEVWPEVAQVGVETADAVLAWHVLEHVEDLAGTLRWVREVLRPGGALVAATPNAASWEARAAGARWHGWDPARHRWHFTAPALAWVLASGGLGVESVRAAGGWAYPAGVAFSLAPAWDPQMYPRRAPAGWALSAACVPAALLARAAGRGGQLVAVARRPA